jgi:hypothetical protein
LVEHELDGKVDEGITFRVTGKDMYGKNIAPKARQAAVDQFNAVHGGAVMLVGPSGREGVHMPATDVIVHMEPCWNESQTDQGSARGCRKDESEAEMKAKVIYRLICAKNPDLVNNRSTRSADEHIYAESIEKRKKCKTVEARLKRIALGEDVDDYTDDGTDADEDGDGDGDDPMEEEDSEDAAVTPAPGPKRPAASAPPPTPLKKMRTATVASHEPRLMSKDYCIKVMRDDGCTEAEIDEFLRRYEISLARNGR